jgi:hypothetical protein
MPAEFGAWQTFYSRFTQWRDAGVFAALMEGMIAEAARRGAGGPVVGQRGLHRGADAPGRGRDGRRSRGVDGPGEGGRDEKGDPGCGQTAPATVEDQAAAVVHEQRRSLLRRHRARLAAAALGRSQGGVTTKVHLAAERRCVRRRSG